MPKSVLDRVIDGVEKMKSERGHGALAGSLGKTEFDFGKAVGTYTALSDVIKLIQSTLDEEKNAP